MRLMVTACTEVCVQSTGPAETLDGCITKLRQSGGSEKLRSLFFFCVFFLSVAEFHMCGAVRQAEDEITSGALTIVASLSSNNEHKQKSILYQKVLCFHFTSNH